MNQRRSAEAKAGLNPEPRAGCPPAKQAAQEPGPPPKPPRPLPVLAKQESFTTFRQALAWVYQRLRLCHGLSATEAARRARVGPQTVRDLEHSKGAPSLKTEEQVAKALGRLPEEVRRLTRRWLRKRRYLRQLAVRSLALVLWLGDAADSSLARAPLP